MGRRAIAILLLVGGLLLLLVVAAFYLLQGDSPPPTVPNTPVAEMNGVNGEGTPEPGGDTVDIGDFFQQTPSAGVLVEVVVSLQTVPRGWQMTEAELTTDMRRAELVDENVVVSVEDVVGQYARTEIFQILRHSL